MGFAGLVRAGGRLESVVSVSRLERESPGETPWDSEKPDAGSTRESAPGLVYPRPDVRDTAPTPGQAVPAGPVTGILEGGLPYARFGSGAAPLILFDGLGFENRAPTGLALRGLAAAFQVFATEYTVYLVTRRPGLPEGFTTRDMAADYACALEAEFGYPVDVIGLSTGGEIAQHFAVDHPALLRRLVLGSTAHRVGDEGKRLLEQWKGFARSGDWRALHASSSVMYASPVARALLTPLLWLIGPLVAGVPKDPSDYLVTIDADLAHETKDRLAGIRAPTLVIAGEEDAFYPVELVQATAEGIEGAWLEVLPAAGHKLGPGAKKRFDSAVLEFLRSRGDS